MLNHNFVDNTREDYISTANARAAEQAQSDAIDGLMRWKDSITPNVPQLQAGHSFDGATATFNQFYDLQSVNSQEDYVSNLEYLNPYVLHVTNVGGGIKYRTINGNTYTLTKSAGDTTIFIVSYMGNGAYNYSVINGSKLDAVIFTLQPAGLSLVAGGGESFLLKCAATNVVKFDLYVLVAGATQPVVILNSPSQVWYKPDDENPFTYYFIGTSADGVTARSESASCQYAEYEEPYLINSLVDIQTDVGDAVSFALQTGGTPSPKVQGRYNLGLTVTDHLAAGWINIPGGNTSAFSYVFPNTCLVDFVLKNKDGINTVTKYSDIIKVTVTKLFQDSPIIGTANDVNDTQAITLSNNRPITDILVEILDGSDNVLDSFMADTNPIPVGDRQIGIGELRLSYPETPVYAVSGYAYNNTVFTPSYDPPVIHGDYAVGYAVDVVELGSLNLVLNGTTGRAPITYIWQRKPLGSTIWSSVAGSTNTVSIPNATKSTVAGTYRMRATNDSGVVYSNEVTVNVIPDYIAAIAIDTHVEENPAHTFKPLGTAVNGTAYPVLFEGTTSPTSVVGLAMKITDKLLLTGMFGFSTSQALPASIAVTRVLVFNDNGNIYVTSNGAQTQLGASFANDSWLCIQPAVDSFIVKKSTDDRATWTTLGTVAAVGIGTVYPVGFVRTSTSNLNIGNIVKLANIVGGV